MFHLILKLNTQALDGLRYPYPRGVITSLMQKHTKEEIEYAESQLSNYLAQGYTYHEAAKQVAKSSPISVISLRYRAYYLNKKKGYYQPNPIQHATHTVHGDILMKCKTKLEKAGYAVISEQNEIRNFVESLGSKGTPDLIAINENETLVVEVAEPEKDMRTLVKQVDRYRKVGRVIIVFPMDTTAITLWGVQNI